MNRTRLPQANASLYAPNTERSWWWLSITCPSCSSIHLGRVREADQAPGPRRAPCGKRITVRVRRTYGAQP